MALPKVYLFRNGGGDDMQFWLAIHEDGTVLGNHCSSSRGWGIADCQPPFKRQQYAEHLGVDDPKDGVDYEAVVVPDGGVPPEAVLKRNRAKYPPPAEAQDEPA